VAWEIEVTDQFTEWYYDLDEGAQRAVEGHVEALEMFGPALGGRRLTASETRGTQT